MMTSTYTTIIFDYGGVLELADSSQFMFDVADVLGITKSELMEEYFKNNHISNTENIPWIEMFMIVVKQFDDSEETEKIVRGIHERVEESKRVNTELRAKIVALKEAGYRVAVLSNYTSQLRINMEENGLLPLFEKVFVSSEIGHQKPQPEIFAHVFETLGVSPEEVIFIDDSPKSLSTASEVGYTPILFVGNEKLFTEFKKLGIDV